MATDKRKQGGRTTAKGTQPAAKPGPSGASGSSGASGPSARRPTEAAPAGKSAGGGKGDKGSSAKGASDKGASEKAPGAKAAKGSGATNPEAPTVNRQMRRGGYDIPDQADAQATQRKRLQIVLGGGGAVTLALTIAGIVLFGVSGTWIGLLGAVAGVGVGFAVSAQKTFLADKGIPAAIVIAVIGVLVNVLAATGVLNVHFPIFAILGCGVGAFFAYVSSQQMTAPPDPPAAAQVMLKRTGAQALEMPGAGNCIWATSDGRIRILTTAAVPEDTDPDAIANQKDYRKSRQAAMLLARRLEGTGAEPLVTCILDWDVPTTRDGDVTICSVSAFPKVLGRRTGGPGARLPSNRPQFKYRAR